MKLDVFVTPGEVASGEIAGRTVVVIDVLRATSSIVEALAAGAKSIYPVGSIEDALRLANTIGRDDVLLCGERKCVPIEGFDLGNSPREFIADRVRGKTLVMTTTNGTYAMSQAVGAARILIGSLFNLGAVVEELTRAEGSIAFICSGRERHFALEDVLCAGKMVSRLLERRPDDWQLNDGAVAAMALAQNFGITEEILSTTGAARLLSGVGLEADVAFSAQIDRHAIVPVLHDRQITLASPLTTVSPR